jgi:predicted deacetylase
VLERAANRTATKRGYDESMTATYLIRFDDLSPTMNWKVWRDLESVLLDHGVRPLLSVVPDNQDERLRVDPPRTDFWEQIRTWQSLGWTIGIHGYQHRYLTDERGLFGWNERSEFAGLSRGEQEDKVGRALEIFEREGTRPDVWVAPNHSFDRTTVEVLHAHGIRTISDGAAMYPFVDAQGMLWIPQQLWRLQPRPLGVWTVCMHPNSWGKEKVLTFSKRLAKFSHRVTDVPTIAAAYGHRRFGLVDRWFVAERQMKKRVATSLARRPTRRMRETAEALHQPDSILPPSAPPPDAS